MATRMSDLPPELVGEEIFTRIPITSLRSVRSTCKLWESLSKNSILGKKAEKFLGFMTMNNKIFSLRFDLRKFKDVEVDISIKQVELLNEFNITKVFQCDGLLLCVTKDNSRLLVWNPDVGQTRCIRPRISFHILDRYALGYEYDKNKKKGNHKILRILDYPDDSKHVSFGYEIYDFSSNLWRVLEVNPDWIIENYQHGVSLKGNTYFFAQEKMEHKDSLLIFQPLDFLLCFDFTTERFGPCLPLPFHSLIGDTVTLSCVREEHLAVRYQRWLSLEIWVTSNIEHNTLSWTKFLKVDMTPLTGFHFHRKYASFFIDEEEKVVVVFSIDQFIHYHTAFIIGDDGYSKSVRLGEVQKISDPSDPFSVYCSPLVCSSSYLPSIVQISHRASENI